MLRALTCLISVNPRELSAYLRMECSYFTCIVELVLPPLDEYMEHPQVREKCISCQLEVTLWLEVGRKYFLCGIIMNWGKVQLGGADYNWIG